MGHKEEETETKENKIDPSKKTEVGTSETKDGTEESTNTKDSKDAKDESEKSWMKDKTPKGTFEEATTTNDNTDSGDETENAKKEQSKEGQTRASESSKKELPKPKSRVLERTLSKINALGFETSAVFAADACALSAITPTRPYTVLIDTIISLIHDLTQTRINIHPSVIINDVLSPTVCSVISTAGTKIVTNYVKVMSQVGNAGIGGETRTATLGFIAQAIASMSSQGSRRFNAEDVLDALRMAAVLRPFRDSDQVNNWTRPAQTMEQNIPHKLFTDSANYTEILALSNALNFSGDIITSMSQFTSHSEYRKLRGKIITTLSELNTMSMMTINSRGLAASITSPELVQLAATFAKRDFSTETRTGCFSLSAFDLLLFLNAENKCPNTVQTFLTDIDSDDFINRACDSIIFENGIDVSENFSHHPTGSLEYDFTAIKKVLEPTETLDMEQLVYLCYQTYFEQDPTLKDAMMKTSPALIDETTYTYSWFSRLEQIYKFLHIFKQLYVDDVRSKLRSGNPLERLIETHRTSDPLSEEITHSLLKALQTVETSNRVWASSCISFNNLIIEEGRDFTESSDWPLTVDKRRAVMKVLEKFNGYKFPTHFQRFSFNPLLNEPNMYVLRNPKKTNWQSNPGHLTTLGNRSDLIWILRPSYVNMIRSLGMYLLSTTIDRPSTQSDIVRLNSSFTLDALDGSCLADTKNVTFEELYDLYSFNDVANRQIISSITDVVVSLEQSHNHPMSDPNSFKLDVHRMFANCVSMDKLKEVSVAIIETSTMANDHLTKSLFITDDMEGTVQRQLASAIGGIVSTLSNKINRGGVLSLTRADLQNWDDTAARMLRAKIHLVQTPIYRQTVSDMLRGAGDGMGNTLYPIDQSFIKHSHAITDIFNVLLRMSHPDEPSFTREILTYLSLPFDIDPSAVFIDITARHLFTPNSYSTASTLEQLVVAEKMVVFNKGLGAWYNQDILINEPIEAEQDLLPVVVDIVSSEDTDVLLKGLFQNVVLKEVMTGSITARTPSYAFHLSVSNQNRIVYRGVTMNNIVRK